MSALGRLAAALRHLAGRRPATRRAGRGGPARDTLVAALRTFAAAPSERALVALDAAALAAVAAGEASTDELAGIERATHAVRAATWPRGRA